MEFRSIEEKKTFQRIGKLHWRILQLHAIGLAGGDRAAHDPARVEQQIEELQGELTEAYRKLSRL